MKSLAIIFCAVIAVTFANDIYSSVEDSSSSYYESFEIDNRITGGDPMDMIKMEKFKYQTGLINLQKSGNMSICGGVLVHSQVVLTCAHCVQNVFFVGVFMGTPVRQTNPYASTNIRVYPQDIVIHSEYVASPNKNDIAVINLPYPAPIGQFVGIIPMASNTNFDCEKGKAWVSGWGRTANEEYSIPNTMQYLEVTPMKADQCQAASYSFIPKQHYCTSGTLSKGVCHGDSGGPYVVEDQNAVRYLCGLNTFILSKNCINNLPKIYTSIPYYLENGWICKSSRNKIGCPESNQLPDDVWIWN